MMQLHDIDFRTSEQFEADKTKEFLEKINELSEQYERRLVPKINYLPESISPIIFIEVRKREEKKAEEPKPEEKK